MTEKTFNGVCNTIVTLMVLLAIGVLISIPFNGARAADGEQSPVNQGVADAYRLDKQTGYFRSSIAAADTAATACSAANLAHCGEFDLTTAGVYTGSGRINVPVSARFSVASRTCVVRLVTGYRSAAGTLWIKDVSDDVTLSGGSTNVVDARYVAPTYVFDSFGANVCYVVLVTAPASGNVSFGVGSY